MKNNSRPRQTFFKRFSLNSDFSIHHEAISFVEEEFAVKDGPLKDFMLTLVKQAMIKGFCLGVDAGFYHAVQRSFGYCNEFGEGFYDKEGYSASESETDESKIKLYEDLLEEWRNIKDRLESTDLIKNETKKTDS